MTAPSFSATNNHHILKITVKTAIWQSKKTAYFFSSPDGRAFSHPFIPNSKVLLQTQPLSCWSQSSKLWVRFSNAVTESNDTSFINAWRGIEYMAGLTMTSNILKWSWPLCETMIRNSQAFQHIRADDRSNRTISPKASHLPDTKISWAPPETSHIYNILQNCTAHVGLLCNCD